MLLPLRGHRVDDNEHARSSTASGRGPLEDRQLVRAAALGDSAAWDTLVDTHCGFVWQLARARTTQQDEARAVVELVWCRLAQAVPHLDGTPLRGWLAEEVDGEVRHARLRAGRDPVSARAERRRQPRAGSG